MDGYLITIRSKNLSGPRIQTARAIQTPKMTQDDLIARLHVHYNIVLSKSTLSRLENRERYVTDLELVAISKILKVPIDWLVGETPDLNINKG